MGVQRLKPTAGGATIKSIQRGTLTFAGVDLTANATITSVDTAKSELRVVGFSSTGPGGTALGMGDYPRTSLESATQVRITRGTANYNVVVGYEVTEWQQG